MEPQHLGYEPIIENWAFGIRNSNKDKDDKTPNYINVLIDKIKLFFKENLQHIRDEFKETIPTVDVNLVKSCLNLCNILLGICKEQVQMDKLTAFEADNYVSMVLIFSFIWSAGGNLHDNSRLKFSQYIKSKILKHFSGFPFEGEVYDYYADFTKKEFRPWMELVNEFKY